MVAPASRCLSRRRPLLTQLLPFARMGLLLWLQFLFPVDTQAQRVALHLGERIRVTWGEILPGEDVDWLFGHVVDATSKSPISILPDGRTQPTAVILDETSQVQRYAGKTVPWVAGGVGGGLIGAIVGAAAMQPLFSNGYGLRDANTLGMAVLSGTVLGAAIGFLGARSLFGRDLWVPVPFVNGVIEMAPLTRTWEGPRLPPTRTQRWQLFDPYETEFMAFLNRYRDSLDLVEGIYQVVGGGDRYAVIRDDRYEDFQFVAVRVATERETLTNPRMGLVFMAFSRDLETGRLSSQPVGGNRFTSTLRGAAISRGTPEAKTYRVRFSLPLLSVEGVGGPILQWVKIFP